MAAGVAELKTGESGHAPHLGRGLAQTQTGGGISNSCGLRLVGFHNPVWE
jgi:hypothetical protein